ncbi:MAG: SEC-C metal-binding domain-containing protein [Pseudomonadota bacterium]
MSDIHAEPIFSTLSRDIERDGKRVWIEIFDDGEGGWRLEVVDEHGNFTGWLASFATEQEALDEVLRTIEQEGIDSVIASISDFSDDELLVIPCPCGSGKPFTLCCGDSGARVLH